MKYICSLLLLLACIANSFGQSTELSVQASSGFFSYGGKSAVSNSYVSINDAGPGYEVYGMFGKKSAFPYGVSFQYQRVTSMRFIMGARLGFDRLSARSDIRAWASNISRGITRGKVVIHNNVLQLNPYLGHRATFKKVEVDFTGGLNLGYILSSNYRVTVDPNLAKNKSAKNNLINTNIDFGPTAGISASYKKVGINATYCYGLVNYRRMVDGDNPEVYSRHLRLGVFYRIF